MPKEPKKTDESKETASAKRKEHIGKKIFYSALLSNEAQEHYEKHRPTKDFNINLELQECGKKIKSLERSAKTFSQFVKETSENSPIFTTAELETFNNLAAQQNISFDNPDKNSLFVETQEMIQNLQEFLKEKGLKYNFVDVNHVMILIENKAIKNLEAIRDANLKNIKDLKLPSNEEQKIIDAVNKKFESDKKNLESQFEKTNAAINKEYQKRINWLNAVAALNRAERQKMVELTKDLRQNTSINIGPNGKALENPHETVSYELDSNEVALKIFPQNKSLLTKIKELAFPSPSSPGTFYLSSDMRTHKTEQTYNNARRAAELIKSNGNDSIQMTWPLTEKSKLLPSEIENLKQIYRAFIDVGFPPDKIQFQIGITGLTRKPEGAKKHNPNPPQYLEDIFSKKELEKFENKGKHMSKSSEEKQKEIWDAIQVKRGAQLEVLENNAPQDQELEVLRKPEN
jgi:hypothetical protein